MGRSHSTRQLRKKVVPSKRSHTKPEVFIDPDADFASIKLAPGVEAKSYTKSGFVFCEDKKGRVIEIQVLNLSALSKKKAI